VTINNSDKDWERFGKTDPYFAVLTAPEFHGQLSPQARSKFLESGEQHIEAMFDIVRDRLDSGFAPDRALDFGCGVGRLVIPLAKRCREVVGVDVSPSMLVEAKKNCEAEGVSNVRFVKSDDSLSGLTGAFDFIHSYIVLQHIPVARGEKIVARLAELLAPNGVAMIQVPYTSGRSSLLSRLVYWARMNAPGAKWLLNVARGRAAGAPVMQMNTYPIASFLDSLYSAGCREAHIRFSDHNGARGALIFARKAALPVFT